MTHKTLQIAGIVLVVLGVVCNQWILSLVFPAEGFHIARTLEMSQGVWGLASKILIGTVEVLCVGLGLIVLRYHKTPRKIIFAISMITTSSILSFVVLELLVRLISPPNMFSPYLPLRPHNKMELHVNLSGVSPFAYNTTNEWGLRGDEPPADWDNFFTVVVIGGSTAQCYYLDDHKTWPYLLQEKLKSFHPNTWVGNGGISGHSTRAHILFVREVISKIRPKTVILLVGVNDLWYSTNDEARTFGNPAERAGWKFFVLGNSRLVQVLFLWKIILYDNVVVLERSANGNFVPEPLTQELEIPSDLRLMLPSLDEYGKNIHTIIADLKSMKVTPIFLTQPLRFDSTVMWKSVVGWEYAVNGKKGKLSAATYAKMLGIFNEELVRVCAAEGVEVYDLASEIPRRGDFFYDFMHFNEKGAMLVAEKVANYIQSHR